MKKIVVTVTLLVTIVFIVTLTACRSGGKAELQLEDIRLVGSESSSKRSTFEAEGEIDGSISLFEAEDTIVNVGQSFVFKYNMYALGLDEYIHFFDTAKYFIIDRVCIPFMNYTIHELNEDGEIDPQGKVIEHYIGQPSTYGSTVRNFASDLYVEGDMLKIEIDTAEMEEYGSTLLDMSNGVAIQVHTIQLNLSREANDGKEFGMSNDATGGTVSFRNIDGKLEVVSSDFYFDHEEYSVLSGFDFNVETNMVSYSNPISYLDPFYYPKIRDEFSKLDLNDIFSPYSGILTLEISKEKYESLTAEQQDEITYFTRGIHSTHYVFDSIAVNMSYDDSNYTPNFDERVSFEVVSSKLGKNADMTFDYSEALEAAGLSLDDITNNSVFMDIVRYDGARQEASTGEHLLGISFDAVQLTMSVRIKDGKLVVNLDHNDMYSESIRLETNNGFNFTSYCEGFNPINGLTFKEYFYKRLYGSAGLVVGYRDLNVINSLFGDECNTLVDIFK